MTDLRQGVSEQAHNALNELEILETATCPETEIGRAMAGIESALETQNRKLSAGRCVLAAARLIRAAELLDPEAAALPMLAGEGLAA